MQELREIFDQLAAGSTDRQRAALAPGRSVAVVAVAGAGKTRALALRYVQHLLCGDGTGDDAAPLAPRQVAAITFTRKAAGELRRRVDDSLAKAEALAAAAPSEARRRIIAAREGLAEAPIGTIHSFCSSLLREYALYAGLDPNFSVLDSRDAAELYDAVLERFWRDLGAEPPRSPRRAAAIEIAARYGMDGVNGLIGELVRNQNLYLFGENAWISAGAQKKSPSKSSSRPSRAAAADPLEERFGASLIGRMAATSPGKLVAAWEKLIGGPMSKPDRELLAAGRVIEIVKMAVDVRARFDAAKAERATLDFEDLERRAWALLVRNTDNVRDTLRGRIHRLLVDEFQDTSPVQWEIIRMIAGDKIGTRLFIVGDPQQSIFGFRNADLRLFTDAARQIRDAQGDPASQCIVAMNDNFRSRAEIINFVNAALPMLQEVGFTTAGLPGAALTDLSRQFQVPHLEMTAKSTKHAAGSVNLILHAREVASAEGDGAIRSMEAEIIARRIVALVSGDAPQRLPGPEGSLVTATFGDIAILVRTRDEFRAFETAFLQREIPFHIVGGKGFYQTPEITDASMLLTVLSDPANDIALAGVLRSPLIGFPDTLLLRLTLAAPGEAATLWERLTAYAQLLEEGRAPDVAHPGRRGERLALDPPDEKTVKMEARLVREAVANIARWRTLVERESLPALLHRIFEDAGAWVLYRAGGRHAQSVANLQKLISLARAFEAEGAGALLEFVDRLATLTREEEEEAEAQTESDRANAVRLMTMHAAKGLEFPIVFAPRLGRQMKPRGSAYQSSPDIGAALRAIDSSEESKLAKAGAVVSAFRAIQSWVGHKEMLEELRLFYVVCTRAEHHLFLSSGWPRHLPKSLAEGPANSLLGMMLQAPDFSKIYDWLLKSAEADEGPACDVLTTPLRAAKLSVEWWRKLDSAKESGVTSDKSSALVEKFFTPERLAALQPLRLEPGDIRISISQLAMISGCPRQWAYYQLLGPAAATAEWGEDEPHPAEEDRGTIEGGSAEEDAPPASAPRGDRQEYGNVCHKMFEIFLRDPGANEVDLIDAAFRMAAPGCDAAQRDAWRGDLRANLVAFRKSDLGRAILAAPERHAELPFVMRRDGFAVRGVIDALYRAADGTWAAADYKTSRLTAENVPRSAASYVPQMALTAAFILARFPKQASATATLYYPFPDCAVPLTFHRTDIDADLAGAMAQWRAMLTSGDLSAFPHAPEWLAHPQFPRSLAKMSPPPAIAPAPRREPCPSCPFLERWCDLPDESKRVMLARKNARAK